MQRIESTHLTLRAEPHTSSGSRAWCAARGIFYFQETERTHDLVLGLFINRYEFGLSL